MRLVDKRIKIVEEILKMLQSASMQNFTSTEIQQEYNISQTTAFRVIRDLKNRGIRLRKEKIILYHIETNIPPSSNRHNS